MTNYPLTIETGETFLTDGQLFRFIREKCGGIIADYLTERIDTDEMPIGSDGALKKLRDALVEIGGDLADLDIEIEELVLQIDNVRGVK